VLLAKCCAPCPILARREAEIGIEPACQLADEAHEAGAESIGHIAQLLRGATGRSERGHEHSMQRRTVRYILRQVKDEQARTKQRKAGRGCTAEVSRCILCECRKGEDMT